MTSSSINGFFYLLGGIVMSIAIGELTTAAWGFFGVGLTFWTGSLIAAFLGNGGE